MKSHYQAFRRSLLRSNGNGLTPDCSEVIRKKMLSSPEIDLLNFVLLKNSRTAFSRSRKLIEEDTRNDVLESAKQLYKTQIAVDEATDFSAVQLGCMYHLSHPSVNSFSVAGDLMQRVTDIGISRWEDCSLFAKLNVQTVDRVYRQSPTLLGIAKVLYTNSLGEEPTFETAYLSGEREPAPLRLIAQNPIVTGEWIAARIAEIQSYNNGELPSVAIFVASDESIDSVREMIEEPLLNHAIEVRGCPKGEILGSEGKVRIFSVQFIKGLEFEGVFFAGIDKIAEKHPDLIDKYLYVGLTRAASFLAITAEERFPEQIRVIEDRFEQGSWSL